MKTIKEIQKELEAHGYESLFSQVEKNGTFYPALTVRVTGSDAEIAPVFYLSKTPLSDVQAEQFIRRVLANMKSQEWSQMRVLADAMKEIITSSNICNFVRIGLQKKCEQTNLLHRDSPFPGLMEYLLLDIITPHGNGTACLQKEMLSHISVPEKQLWECAKERTINHATVMNMVSNIEHILEGAGFELTEEAVAQLETLKNPPDALKMYVIRCDLYGADGKGAASVYNTALLEYCAREMNCEKLLLLPSSIHEMLVVRADDKVKEDFATMVKQVNQTQVSETECLINGCYVVSPDLSEIEWMDADRNENVK